ncbi:MAG: hypothetical protein ACP5O1_02250 [Phycisphaerae bacterium]
MRRVDFDLSIGFSEADRWINRAGNYITGAVGVLAGAMHRRSFPATPCLMLSAGIPF